MFKSKQKIGTADGGISYQQPGCMDPSNQSSVPPRICNVVINLKPIQITVVNLMAGTFL